MAFAVVMLFLIVRPSGILGEKAAGLSEAGRAAAGCASTFAVFPIARPANAVRG